MVPLSSQIGFSSHIVRRPWWSSSLRGAFALLFGLVALIWPNLTLLILVTLFGAYAFVDGVAAVIAALQERRAVGHWWVVLLEGLASVVLGIVTLTWPTLTAFALLYVIAAWAVITGILEIVAAFFSRISPASEWTLALGGVLSVLLGLLLAIQPGMGLHVLVWFIGIYALFFGALLVLHGFHRRSSAT